MLTPLRLVRHGMSWLAVIVIALTLAAIVAGIVAAGVGLFTAEFGSRAGNDSLGSTLEVNASWANPPPRATLRERCEDAAGAIVLAGEEKPSHVCHVEHGKLSICDIEAADGPHCWTEPLRSLALDRRASPSVPRGP